VEFRIPGPLEVVEGGRALTLGGSRQRALLALLLTRANEVVSAGRLIDELWGERAPKTASNALQYHVSQLRKTLAPAEAIVTQEPGYLIRVGPGELDLLRFERLVEEAQQSSAELAARLLRDALGLWRGPALADPSASRSHKRRLSAWKSFAWSRWSSGSPPTSSSGDTPSSSGSSRRSFASTPCARVSARSSCWRSTDPAGRRRR